MYSNNEVMDNYMYWHMQMYNEHTDTNLDTLLNRYNGQSNN